MDGMSQVWLRATECIFGELSLPLTSDVNAQVEVFIMVFLLVECCRSTVELAVYS